MHDSHPILLPVNRDTRLLQKDSVVEAEEHSLYKSIIRSRIYLVTGTTPQLIILSSSFFQFHTAPSKFDFIAAKHLLWSLTGTKY
jgi:hypothetical protein